MSLSLVYLLIASWKNVNVSLALRDLDSALSKFNWIDGNIARVSQQINLYSSITSKYISPVVCETGFNAGHSAVVFLASNPQSSYIGFDFGIHEFGKNALHHLEIKYPGRISVNWGNSRSTIPSFFEHKSSVKCDIVSIDGDHSCDGIIADFKLLKKHANEDSTFLFDDTSINACPIHRLGIQTRTKCYSHHGKSDTMFGNADIKNAVATKGFCVHSSSNTLPY